MAKLISKDHTWDEIDELTSKVAKLEETKRGYRDLYEKYEWLKERVNKLERPKPPIHLRFRKWLWHWLWQEWR